MKFISMKSGPLDNCSFKVYAYLGVMEQRERERERVREREREGQDITAFVNLII